MSASLDFNWLRGLDKSLSLPVLVYQEQEAWGGCYLAPSDSEILIDQSHYDQRNGIIIISTLWPENIPAVLAHEFRHHWQHSQGWIYDGSGWNTPADYESAIKKYFLSSICEFDALRYEFMKSRNDVNDFWRGLLFG